MSKNTIIVKEYLGIREEAAAAEEIMPGHCLDYNASLQFVKHGTVGGPCPKIFAIEDAYQGNTIADAYETGSRVIAKQFQPGEKVYAVAAGDSTDEIAVGDKVKSNGDGTLSRWSDDSGDSGGELSVAIGIAEEAVEGGDHFVVRII